MKKNLYTKLILSTLGMLFVPAFVFAAPKVDMKQDLAKDYPLLSVKSCSQKYDTEVKEVYKLVDSDKAKKAVANLKSLRKDQDKDIENIFTDMETEATSSEQKVLIKDARGDVQKALDIKRSKMDTLLDSSLVTQTDIEKIVVSTILEQDLDEKACPINQNNQKVIRTGEIAKLKKLNEDKKAFYQKQTKAIQDEFLSVLQKTLESLSQVSD